MPSEASLEGRCCAHAKGLGCWPLKLWPTLAGLPDRLLLIPGGRVWFVEFKTPTGRVSKIQQWVHRRLAGLGFRVSVVREYADFKARLAARLTGGPCRPQNRT